MDPYPTLKEYQQFKTNFVEKSKDECWEWVGCIDTSSGYGTFAYRSGPVNSHRLYYFFENPTAPQYLDVLHKCDNRKCVNPNHMFLGTNSDNAIDMIEKGRAHYNTYITKDDAKTIVLLKETMKTKDIAKKYNTTSSSICRVLSGERKAFRK